MTPETFERELNARCAPHRDRHFRLRQSIFDKAEWFIEQKVSRATEVPVGGDPDLHKRVSDGYALVMRFYRAPVIACPQCGHDVRLPEMRIGETRCEYCHARPQSYGVQLFFTGYFPLCDALIAHLERTSLKRGDAWVKEMVRKNAQVAEQKRKAVQNVGRDIALDWRTQIGQVPHVGWGNGPASLGRV